MELKLRQPVSTGTITGVHLQENGSTFDGEMAFQDFPVRANRQKRRHILRFSMILEGPIGGSGGACHATAAMPMGDGTLITVFSNGRWRRTGTTIVCRHVVDVSNGWMNLDIAEWDITGTAITLAVHILE